MSPHLRGVAIKRSLVFVSHNLMYAEPTKARGLSVKWSKNKLTIKSDAAVSLFLSFDTAVLLFLSHCHAPNKLLEVLIDNVIKYSAAIFIIRFIVQV